MESTLTLPDAASAAPTRAQAQALRPRRRTQAPTPEERALTYQLRDGQFDPLSPLQTVILQAGLSFEF